jgi:hypothetical protein
MVSPPPKKKQKINKTEQNKNKETLGQECIVLLLEISCVILLFQTPRNWLFWHRLAIVLLITFVS